MLFARSRQITQTAAQDHSDIDGNLADAAGDEHRRFLHLLIKLSIHSSDSIWLTACQRCCRSLITLPARGASLHRKIEVYRGTIINEGMTTDDGDRGGDSEEERRSQDSPPRPKINGDEGIETRHRSVELPRR